MASAPDEHSPPRSDALPRSRRLSTLMDSPSRVTRSQVRRLSSAAGIAEAPMSPKPAVSTRRRSTAAAKSEAALQEEAPAAQEEPDAGKALPRRRSVRKSFADGNEEGPLSSRSSKLSSIDEDSKAHSKEEPKSIAMAESRPVTRRTRASMASAPEPEPDLCLPPRRTRRSSVSSVSSITSSVVASPRTRSRKNLSPVPSPTVSEVSIVSEVPETSPASKTSPRKDSSPMTKKSSTPRQLQLHDSDSTKTRRSSFVVSENIQGEGISSKTDDAESCQPVRRSQGRFSLKSPLKFVETAKEDTVTSNCDAEKKSNNEGDVEVELNKSRSSIGRLSLSSNKSSRLSLSSNKSSPNKLSPSVLGKFESSPHVPLTGSRRSSRSSLSSSKASPAENLKSALHSTESQDKVKWESMSPNVTLHNILNVTEENAGSPRLTLNGSLRESTGRLSRKTSPFKFDVSDRVSPNKCQPATSSSENVLCHDTSQEITSNSSVLPEKNELNNSRRSSTQMVSEGKSPMSNFQEVTLENSSSPDSTVNKVSTEQQVFDVEDSSTDPSLVEVVVEKRNSMGRLSLASNVATPGKVQSPDCPSKVSNIETKGRFSLSSNKSTPAKSPKVDNFEVSNAGSQKTLFSRVSLSSNKSTPAKSPHFDNFEVSNTDSNEETSLNRFSLSSNKATPSKAEATQDDVSTPNTSGSSEKLSPANSSECDSPRLTNEDAPNTFLSRFSLSFNKSTPAKASPAKSPKCDNTPQLQLNESHRSSIGRLSLSSSKSPHSAGLKPTDEAEHLPDNEESDSVSSTDPSQHDESMGKLNLSGKAEMPSSTKSTERRSLTPSKSLITSHHQEEDARSDENDDDANDESSNDASDNADGDPSNDGDGDASNNADGDASSNASNDSHELLSKIVSLFDSREVSRRASTGNLSMKPLKSDLKTRASMGPLINPLMSYPDDSDDENDSSNLSGDIGDSSNTANDRNQFGKGELTLSPIKPDIPPKKRSLTPSSDKPCNESERQKSPSNPFEKSSVFDNDSFASDSETSEQAVEMSLSSHTPSKLNISINDEKNVSIAVDQLAEAADLESSKRFSKTPAKDVPEEESTSISKVSSHKKQGLAKYYQAAAVLMSGGKISDFDDDDSDDSQLQTVFSPSTMSKREKKLERKARKKAAKEAKKKQKQERMLSLSVADDAKKTDNKENTLQTQNSPYPGNSMKRISMEANLASSEGSNVMVEELDSSGKTSNKRRKTQSQSECDLPLVDYENPSPLKNDEKPTEANIQSAKKLKLKSGSADLKVDIIHDHGESETSNTSPVVETACKKKKKKKKAETVTATDMQLNADDTALSKKKKKKLKEKGLVDSAPAAELPLKAKKKKLKKSVLGDEAPVEDLTLKAKKKKLKKSVLGDEALVEDLPLKAIKKKLKKSVLSDETLVEDLTLKAKKKKLKKNVLGDEASVEDLTLKAKKKKLKKSVLGDGAPVEDLSNKKKKKKPKVAPEDHSVEETTTETLTIKKKKKKDLVLQPLSASEDTDISGKQRLPASASTADGSDSDDAPTSVSFAAGKNTALALMQAATLNIKKQEEMKKMKMKKRQEKRREEKSAKRLKLGINIIDEDEDVGGSTSMKGGFPVSSSKIIFDDKGNSQRVKPPKRLPTDLLESLSEQPPTKFFKRPDGSKEKVPADSVSSLEHKKEEMKKARKLARKLEKAKLLQADYVPLEGALGATRFGVVPLRNVMLAKKLQKSKLAEEAANFRKEHLFGNRIHRTPITSAISHEEKRKAAKAGRFMNKKYL